MVFSISALIVSDYSPEEILKKIADFNAIFVRPNIVNSKEQLELAYFLAKKSFKEKKNIARDFKLEFLLWLTGKKDIKTAIALSIPKNEKALVIVLSDSSKNSNKTRIKNLLGAKNLELTKKADQFALENISLSRII